MVESLEENISSSFDFISGKVRESKVLKIDRVEIRKAIKSKIAETEVENFYLVIIDGQKEFKVELIGIYRTSRDWIILSDIAPWYF